MILSLPKFNRRPKLKLHHLITLPLFTLLLTSNCASAQTGSTNTTRDSAVVFNEIHYQPLADDSTLEYVELYNQLVVDVDISNWHLDGIDFDFPEGTVIGGREYLVIAKDPAALGTATGHSNALGPFAGSLSNSGETLRLYNNNRASHASAGANPTGSFSNSFEGRRVMDEITFSDTFPWPVATDGSGVTLAKISPIEASAHPANWSHGTTINGTPGTANTTVTSLTVAFNEVSAVDLSIFDLELVNHGPNTASLNGLIITSSNPLRDDYLLPAISLPSGEFHLIDETTLGYVPIDNERLFLFAPGKASLIDAVRVDDRPLARMNPGTGPWLRPSSPTYGSANTFALEDSIVINEIFYNPTPIRAEAGAAIEVIDFDHVWRYNLDAGTAGLPAAWANSGHAVDNVNWSEGPGLLGFESTTLGEPLLTSITREFKIPYYFETEFQFNGTDSVDSIEFENYIDDGAVFYLNGVELGRTPNMPTGTIVPTTTPNPSVGNATLETLTFNSPNLLPGTNRISVEVHQVNTGSSDMVFGTKVTLNTSTPYQERDEEWIELYNRGPADIDLTGWQLEGGISYNLPATTLASGSYLVIAKDASTLSAKHPSATVIGDYSGRLGNGGDEVILTDAAGNPADEVTYFDSRRWHSKADGGGSSLELIDPDSDNSNPQAWAPSDESSRTSWNTYSYETVAVEENYGVTRTYHEFLLALIEGGEVLLDDISLVENGTIEFISNGDFESDSLGSIPADWRVLGNHGSHGRTVVIDDPDSPGNKCLHLVATGATDDKQNKLEINLDNNQTIVPGSAYTVTFRAKFLSGNNMVNTRSFFNYIPKTTIIDTPDVWGTPGAANTAALANAGPTLADLSHNPVVPNSGQSTTVTITAEDPDGINNLTLFYSVNDGAFQSSSMTANGDGTYSGTIPGQSASRIVRFYVRARDTSNATTFYPAEGDQSGALYKVQDNLADTSGIRRNFRIVMSPSDTALLFLDTNRLSNDRIAATVIEDESRVYYDVGIRLKASAAGRYLSDRYGFNIEFQPDHLYRGVHSTIALERAANEDVHEILTKHLLNRAGGYWSYYDDVAKIITPTASASGIGLISTSRNTSNFLDALYPDSDGVGLLFNHEIYYNSKTSNSNDFKTWVPNPEFKENDFQDRRGDKELYRLGFQTRNERGRDEFTQIIALNQALRNLSGTALKEAIEPLIDVDQWMRSYAMLSLNGSRDMIGRGFAHNVRYYVRPTDGKMIMFIWDNDNAYRFGTSDSLPPVKHQITKLFTIPEFRRMFDGHLLDIIETTYNSTYISPWVSHFQSVTGPSSTSKLSYITNRSNYVLGQLPSSIPFVITTNGGANFSVEASNTVIEGDAWIDVFAIQINGVPTPITWTDAETWQITAPLPVGANPLTISAYNNQGVLVGTDVITVTNTSPVVLASASNTSISELHYHPAEPSAAEIAANFDDQDFFEFVEITNISTDTVDFTNVSFILGVTYNFPAGTTLAPGERLILVANQAAFAHRYSGITTFDQYNGNLRNSGEQVRLEAADAIAIADFTYGDASPWPDSADGDGYSLVFNGTDATQPNDWRPSTTIGGNPSTTDSTPYPGGDLLVYLVANGPTADFTNDSFSISVDLNLDADAAIIKAQFSSDLDTWTDATIFTQVNNGDGTSTLTATPSSPSDTKLFGRFVVKLR
ncbi:lamin tail domain-containing protein [Akkermansiaceae bacterium]|nr:lamin tail domain-containing protein [Akkermansiaceae bacterium]